MIRIAKILSTVALFVLIFCPQTSIAESPHTGARTIAERAYIYAFPMLENYQTFYKQAVDNNAPEYVGGFNKFRNYSEPFTPDNHDVVTPNNDTPYSWAWLDLRAEPVVIIAPAVPKGRYYAFQLIDLFTYNFGYIGVRSTGSDAGNYLIAGPNWHGETPKGIAKTFTSDTEFVGVLGRTQLDGADDQANVQALQAQYKIQPLHQFLGTAAPPPAPAITFPPYDKTKAKGPDFIRYLNFLLQFSQWPPPGETALMEEFARIGIGPGKEWNPATLNPKVLAAIDAGVDEGQDAMKATIARTRSSNGLFGSRAFLGKNYLKRAVAAAMGLYGNSMEEAWYAGYEASGAEIKFLRFPTKQLPPAKFFWSITLYTLPDRLLYANQLNRYSIGDRTKSLKYGADGSLSIYVGHASPGSDKETNWLPAPEGPYSLVVRVYGPEESVLKGEWKPPALESLNESAH